MNSNAVTLPVLDEAANLAVCRAVGVSGCLDRVWASSVYGDDPFVALQRPVHERDAGQHQGVGGRAHELRGPRDELPHRQRDRRAVHQGDAPPEVQVSRVSEHRHAVRRPDPHGREVGLHHQVHQHLRHDAAEDGRVPRRPGPLQGQLPGHAETLPGHRRSVNGYPDMLKHYPDIGALWTATRTCWHYPDIGALWTATQTCWNTTRT